MKDGSWRVNDKDEMLPLAWDKEKSHLQKDSKPCMTTLQIHYMLSALTTENLA